MKKKKKEKDSYSKPWLKRGQQHGREVGWKDDGEWDGLMLFRGNKSKRARNCRYSRHLLSTHRHISYAPKQISKKKKKKKNNTASSVYTTLLHELRALSLYFYMAVWQTWLRL